ncbi:MAG TPA: reverse transcriptase/maturase family protein [Candidatus Paceibacterota bacterium]
MRSCFTHSYKDIISVENLLDAWGEFLKGKRNKADVREFSALLMYNVLALHRELAEKTYEHGGYEAFKIADPKPRDIHKALVRDRLVHHAIYRQLYPFFDRVFIADSYSSRKNKGTHKAMNRFRAFGRAVSKNRTRTCWVLKCDIRKFFASIDQAVLMELVRERIADANTVWLVGEVVRSFHSTEPGKGLPLGNLTSQLLVNVYMNEFDQWVKHGLKAKRYIRYADDFVFFSADRTELETWLLQIRVFLRERLKLDLHPKKVSIETLASGIDFLGWVHFPNRRVLRTNTKRRMLKNVRDNPSEATCASYRGMLSHGNTHKLGARLFDTGQRESNT